MRNLVITKAALLIIIRGNDMENTALRILKKDARVQVVKEVNGLPSWGKG